MKTQARMSFLELLRPAFMLRKIYAIKQEREEVTIPGKVLHFDNQGIFSINSDGVLQFSLLIVFLAFKPWIKDEFFPGEISSAFNYFLDLSDKELASSFPH